MVLDAPPEDSEKTTALIEPETGREGRALGEKGSDLVGSPVVPGFASGVLVADGGGPNLGAFPLETPGLAVEAVSEVAGLSLEACSTGGVEAASGVAVRFSATAGVGLAEGTGRIWLSP